MKKLAIILGLLLAVTFTACDDNPTITFHNYSGEYTLNGKMRLQITVNGLQIVDRPSGVEFTWSGGDIAQIAIIAAVEGAGDQVVGGVTVTELPDGSGIAFQGKFPISDTEMMAVSGTIVDMVMTLDIQTFPIQE